MILSTLYMQRVFGFSALETGLGFLPLAVSAGIGGPLASRLIERLGARRVAAASQAVTATALLYVSQTADGGNYAATLLPAFLIAGCSFATGAVPLVAEAVADAPAADRGAASGLFQTSTHAGGAVVVAALAIVAAGRTEAALSAGSTDPSALSAGLEAAFLTAAGTLTAGAFLAAALLRGAASPPPGCSRSRTA